MNIANMLQNSHVIFLLAAIAASPAAAFSLTGKYEGVVACDSTTAGEASTWGWQIELLILQDGSDLRVDYKYIDAAELGAEYTLYTGVSAISKDGSAVSAYFKSCDASFPSDELVRVLPAATRAKEFGFTADSIWISDSVPNLPRLTVQSCRWSLDRVSKDIPEIRSCPSP